MRAIRKAALPLERGPHAYDPLLERIGDARLVLLGEASHGTEEFYRERAEITKRLIAERGVAAIAVEADWPDAYRVNQYVRGKGADPDAEHALSGFRRFPQWMWRNTVTVELVEWLRAYNEALPAREPRTGFYGLDLYSLRSSMEAVLRYLEHTDPAAARRVAARYACFDQFDDDTQVYGFLTSSGVSSSCEAEVLHALVDLQRRRGAWPRDDAGFDAERNAQVVKAAEAYYRSMFLEQVSSWNLRDQHMAETLDRLVEHLSRNGPPARIVVWAHNSHLGDARATEMGGRGEVSVGQLVRERYGLDAVLVGFTTARGTVTAASRWDGPALRKRVRTPPAGSFERLFHETGLDRFLLTWNEEDPLAGELRDAQLERAIGVIYRPETERSSHYFWARLADQFDAVLHFDETSALEPLERAPVWSGGEVPETYPSAV